MKKSILLLLLIALFLSCGPKRAKCYGYRCEETSSKKENANP